MKCRALGTDNSVIWFGKDLKAAPRFTFWRLDDTGETGWLDIVVKTDTFVKLPDNKTYRVEMKDSRRGILIDDTAMRKAGVVSLAAAKTLLDNYAVDTDGVAASLTQRLSVIKGELWYQANFGLPLLEKQRGTTILDFVISDIITSHPGVASLDSFTSKIIGHTYYYNCSITSVFGDNLTITNNLAI